ncbi:MAG: Hpt domain-containing protein [Bacteroidales bacterium]|jgi:HPt (histidine-containing phosphotransfer) domain-containing protein
MPEEKLYDLSFLNKISGGDENFIREMINTFKEVAPAYLKRARTNLKQEAIDALSKETHRFIPGVSFLGAKKLEEDLMKIEEFTKKNENMNLVPGLIDDVDQMINKLIENFDRDFNF